MACSPWVAESDTTEQPTFSHICVCLNFMLLCLDVWSCPTLGDPMDYSPPGSSVHGIFQARILEWAAMPVSRDLPNPGIKPLSPASPAIFSFCPGKGLFELLNAQPL